MIFDNRLCGLGEGPLWHPIREQLFWFDITAGKLLSRDATGPLEWAFPFNVSAAGWINRDELLIASETAFLRFSIATGAHSHLAALDAENPNTRSNDGRADPQGGFWIGTMGKAAEAGVGGIWRFYKGEVRLLFKGISIPNAISFPPGGKAACFCDTVTGQVMRTALDGEGWPVGEPEVFLDLRAQGLNPDGAVFDKDGVFWLAEWGAARVAAYAPDGAFLRALPFNAPHTSCPAFGGPGLSTLFCTTARQGMEPDALAAHPDAGKTFAVAGVAQGQSEHMVTL